ncbi:MAG: hypothetical protein Q9227_008054 [Pyrenula ochraceoflavens]
MHIPESSSTVEVSIIDNGSHITGMQGSDYMSPVLPGYETFDGPSYIFLLHHKPTNTHLLFDLGIRTDWETAYAPGFVQGLQDEGMGLHVDRDVTDILHEHGISPSEISTIIFSHHHFDHTGDTTNFPSSTRIIVGPGYKEAYLPGYPEDPENDDTTSDLYEGREVTEIDFSPSSDPKLCEIGGFQAYDYFSDGSFYLLNTPGHTLGHLSALARTTANAQEGSTFIFLGGDIVSSNQVIRPSEAYPLPDQVHTSSSNPSSSSCCPGAKLAKLHHRYSPPPADQRSNHHHQGGRPSLACTTTTTPFCLVAGDEEDLAQSQRNADKLRIVFDGEPNILTIWSHDAHLKPVLEFFPVTANGWKAKGWKAKAHWRWLDPCVEALRRREDELK